MSERLLKLEDSILVLKDRVDNFVYKVGNPYHDDKGRFTTGPSGLHVFHGTSKPGFREFRVPQDNEVMIDRALGVHVAPDSAIASFFAEKGGGVYPLKVAPNAKFLAVDQPLLPFVPPGTPKTARNVVSDQFAIEHLVFYHVYAKHPEMLARYLEQARAVPKVDALRLARNMSAGGTIDLPVDGPGWTLERFIRNFGGKPYNKNDRAEAVSLFRRDMQDEGYVGIKYINTSPMETANAKDPTSYIIFNPKHLRSAIMSEHAMGKLLTKAGFDPDEARDEHGRWSTGSATSAGSSTRLAVNLGPPRYSLRFQNAQNVSSTEVYHQYALYNGSSPTSLVVHLNVGDPKIIYIEWIGRDLPEDVGENLAFVPLKLGPKIIRDIARQLKHLYPQAETISGERVSGARHGRVGQERSYKPDMDIVSMPVSMIKRLEEEFLKAGFDPGEARDERGRWAIGGEHQIKLDATMRGVFKNKEALARWRSNLPKTLYHGSKRKLTDLYLGSVPAHAAIGGDSHVSGIYLTDSPTLAASFGDQVYAVTGADPNFIYPDPEYAGDDIKDDYSLLVSTKDISGVKLYETPNALPLHYNLSKVYNHDDPKDSAAGTQDVYISNTEQPLIISIWGGSSISITIYKRTKMFGRMVRHGLSSATFDFKSFPHLSPALGRLKVTSETRPEIQAILEQLWHTNKGSMFSKAAKELKTNTGSDVHFSGEVPASAIKIMISSFLDYTANPEAALQSWRRKMNKQIAEEDRFLLLKDRVDSLEVQITKEFDPDQPRDEGGRWSQVAAIAGSVALGAIGLIGALFVRGYRRTVFDTAAKYGLPRADVSFAFKSVRSTNGVVGTVMGRANLETGKISIFPLNLPLALVRSTVAHEATHIKEAKFLGKHPDWAAWVERNAEQFRKEGGVSSYSNKFWDRVNAPGLGAAMYQRQNTRLAIQETIAEISDVAEQGRKVGGRYTRQYYDAIMADKPYRSSSLPPQLKMDVAKAGEAGDVEQRTINGKKAFVAFFDKDFKLASEANAVIAKIVFANGNVEFVALDQPISTRK